MLTSISYMEKMMALKLRLRGGIWYAMGTMTRLDGKSVRVKRSTKYTLNQKKFASVMLPKIELEVFKQTDKPKERSDDTIAEMVRRYLSRPSGIGQADKYNLYNFDGMFGKRKVSDLKAEEVYNFFEAKGNSTSTIRRQMNSLIACINHSKDRGFPFVNLKLVRPPEGEGRVRWLNEKERDRLIHCCDDLIKDNVAFLFYTGARLGESWALTDKDVFEDEVILRSRKGRNKKLKYRRIALAKTILPMVKARCAKGGLLFTDACGNKWTRSGRNTDGRKTDNTFYNLWHQACERAGIEDFLPHDCRHTFASLLRQKGVGLDELQELLGHSDLSMVMRYAHLAPTRLKSVIEHLDTSKDVSVPNLSHKDVVLSERIELSTSHLPSECSTTELRQHTSDDPSTRVKEGSIFLTKDKKAHLEDKKPP